MHGPVSMDAAMAMPLAPLNDDGAEARGMLPLFDALVEVITGGAHRH